MTSLTSSTDSVGPRRFLSVHGHRAAIFGYSEAGLEVWAYPVQILSSYAVSFRHPGVTTLIDGQAILRRIVYRPESVTRIYAGPDFIVREKLFVPLDDPGVIIEYTAESARPIDIELRFIPVLDLMWPAGMGGQEIIWNDAASSYSLFEPAHRFSASIGSPDIVSHDETHNLSQRPGRSYGVAFTIRANGVTHRAAKVVIAGGVGTQDATAIADKLAQPAVSLEKNAIDQYVDLLSHSLRIQTPDAETNRALAWSEIALDQAWVCNPDLGCGIVAGYGPSRKARRPQYDWFFAGDGMVAVHGLLAAGQYERARQELEFIFKYQDQKTGMIWHELSQSAGQIDWKTYPYMFVHVDLTYEFLDTVASYYVATGDSDFVRSHWSSIDAAYAYCRSLLDSKDGLPRIPLGKEGSREQDPLGDELALSASWADASQALATLAAVAGHDSAAQNAAAANLQAGAEIRKRYWDEPKNFWITGYTRSGVPVVDRDLGPSHVITKSYFTERQRGALIGQLASADFQTDWGTRGKASTAPTYDPNAYSTGSVWAIRTAGVALAFWAVHRPVIALPIWSSLVPWSSLDSMGHIHEAAAGDYFHEEEESVPEQTWSSASFLSAAVNGMFGLQVDGAHSRLSFAPHLPPDWDAISLRNLRVGASKIAIDLTRSRLSATAELTLHLQNEGPPLSVSFNPEIPLGATLLDASLADQSIPVTMEQHPQDAHAKLEFALPRGNTSLTLKYSGGVALVPEPAHPAVGDPSHALKITGLNLADRVYTVTFDYPANTACSFTILTPWTIESAQSATFLATSPGAYKISVNQLPSGSNQVQTDYEHGKVVITFAGK